MKRVDPRLYQIAMLSGLLGYGIAFLGFEFDALQTIAIIGTALVTQAIGVWVFRLPAYDPRSPLISALSLCLLLRTDALWLAMTGAFIAIAGKFLIRVRSKHVFNPTNIALAALMLCTDRVWVSPGQWGSAAYAGFLMACLGVLIVNRAERSDVTYAFIGFYLTILFGRTWWLGDPWAIPLHQLQSGAFLLFAFFMISDPKTTPDTRGGRVAFALLVAVGAAFVHFVQFRNNGLIWSLAVFAMAVPVIDAATRTIQRKARSPRISNLSSPGEPVPVLPSSQGVTP